MINLKQVKTLVLKCIKKDIVPYVVSAPGLGKSAMAMQLAEEVNAEFIDVRLAQCDPTDLNGFPIIKDGVATFMPFDTFPTEDMEPPKGKNGWVLMLDELSSCPRSIQAAAYKIILDRKVGQKKLHPKVRIIAAGNRSQDNAHVNSMSTALQSRMVHLEVGVCVDSWIDWATNNKIDSRVISFVGYRKNLLHSFDPKHQDHTFPCPRTWHFLSNLIEDEPEITTELIPLLEGTVGKGASVEFRNYIKFFDEIVTLDEVLANPAGVTLPAEAGHKYALTSMLADSLTVDNGEKLMQCILRLPIEFQAMCVITAMRRDHFLEDVPAVFDWFNNTAYKF